MISAVICAGGIGSRMGNVEKPKQYLKIGKKPIIIHTIEKFFMFDEIEEILVVCPESWVNHTMDLVKKYCDGNKKVKVLKGGDTRNETIMNAIHYLEETHGLSDEDIVITHDSVRPFLTYRIIKENIEIAKKVGACDTVIPATDTIVECLNGEEISSIPDRKYMYQGQTPQSFKAKKLKELYYSLSDEEKGILTDAAKIYVLKNEPIHIVRGEVSNIKITYPYDLKVAEAILSLEALDKE